MKIFLDGKKILTACFLFQSNKIALTKLGCAFFKIDFTHLPVYTLNMTKVPLSLPETTDLNLF